MRTGGKCPRSHLLTYKHACNKQSHTKLIYYKLKNGYHEKI
jgi:hypothetical protein